MVCYQTGMVSSASGSAPSGLIGTQTRHTLHVQGGIAKAGDLLARGHRRQGYGRHGGAPPETSPGTIDSTSSITCSQGEGELVRMSASQSDACQCSDLGDTSESVPDQEHFRRLTWARARAGVRRSTHPTAPTTQGEQGDSLYRAPRLGSLFAGLAVGSG